MRSVMKYPLSTEKSIRLMESENKLIFIVEKNATKEQIKEDIEVTFKAKVKKGIILPFIPLPFQTGPKIFKLLISGFFCIYSKSSNWNSPCKELEYIKKPTAMIITMKTILWMIFL